MNGDNEDGNLDARRDAILESLNGFSDAEKTDVLAEAISAVLDSGGKGKLDPSNPAERDELDRHYKVMMAPLVGLPHETALDLLVNAVAFTLFDQGMKPTTETIARFERAFGDTIVRLFTYFEDYYAGLQIEQASADRERDGATVH